MARFKVVILGWVAASVFFTAVLEVSELGHKPLGFALYSNALHFALWALTLPLLTKAIRRFPLKDPNRIRNAGIRLLLVAVLGMLVTLAHLAILVPTYFPYRNIWLRSALFQFLPYELPYDVLIGIVVVMAIDAWQVVLELQAERMRAIDLERQLAVSRLEALQMQLHPHFLFNTLHTIAGLIGEEPPTARRMVIALGELLRSTLKGSSLRMRTLAEELEFSDLYLEIEKLRLGDRLVLHYDIDPSTARALVPQFLLQPLFENAIRHGASEMIGPCEIRFWARRERSVLYIAICNDGPKRSPSSGRARFGVGLTNTMDRLRIQYGNLHGFHYSDRPEGGVQVEISIPYRDAVGDNDRRSLRRNVTAQDTDRISQPVSSTFDST
jgi:sensor histidine kinase YesM